MWSPRRLEPSPPPTATQTQPFRVDIAQYDRHAIQDEGRPEEDEDPDAVQGPLDLHEGLGHPEGDCFLPPGSTCPSHSHPLDGNPFDRERHQPNPGTDQSGCEAEPRPGCPWP